MLVISDKPYMLEWNGGGTSISPMYRYRLTEDASTALGYILSVKFEGQTDMYYVDVQHLSRGSHKTAREIAEVLFTEYRNSNVVDMSARVCSHG